MIFDLTLFQCVLKSWQNCIQYGLPNDVEKPLIILTEREIDKTLRLKSEIIHSFNYFCDKYSSLIKNIKLCYYLTLFDNEANLLAVRLGSDIHENHYSHNSFLEAGVSFNERSVGTNAVFMSKLFKKPIYLFPDFHYCDKLKSWHVYCAPVMSKGNIKGYISVISISEPLNRALRCFIDLMAVNLIGELYVAQNDDYLFDNPGEQLTNKQYLILRMIAQGLSDEYISKELKITLSTVKYHNQNIFKTLNANSRVDAVIKALLSNKLNFYDILNE